LSGCVGGAGRFRLGLGFRGEVGRGFLLGGGSEDLFQEGGGLGAQIGHGTDEGGRRQGMFGLIEGGQDAGFEFSGQEEQGDGMGEAHEGIGGAIYRLSADSGQHQFEHGWRVGVFGQQGSDGTAEGIIRVGCGHGSFSCFGVVR